MLTNTYSHQSTGMIKFEEKCYLLSLNKSELIFDVESWSKQIPSHLLALQPNERPLVVCEDNFNDYLKKVITNNPVVCPRKITDIKNLDFLLIVSNNSKPILKVTLSCKILDKFSGTYVVSKVVPPNTIVKEARQIVQDCFRCHFVKPKKPTVLFKSANFAKQA